jgi:hypothetical protein
MTWFGLLIVGGALALSVAVAQSVPSVQSTDAHGSASAMSMGIQLPTTLADWSKAYLARTSPLDYRCARCGGGVSQSVALCDDFYWRVGILRPPSYRTRPSAWSR